MNEAGKFSHALYAVLYAARNSGCNLDHLLQKVKQDIVGDNSIRPLPQDQHVVIEAVEQAIKDISR